MPNHSSARRHRRTPTADQATTDHATINAWYESAHEYLGVGIATGAKSNVWVLEVSIEHELLGPRNLNHLVDRFGAIPTTPTSLSGFGNANFWFKWDNDRPIKSGAEAGFTIVEGIEVVKVPALGKASGQPVYNADGTPKTRDTTGLYVYGTGDVVAAPPTIDANGERHRWIRGLSMFDLEMAEAPRWLHAILKSKLALPGGGRPRTSATSPACKANRGNHGIR